MKIIVLVLAVFTCLVCIGLTFLLYALPETFILNNVNNLQKSGQHVAGLWLFFSVLLLGAIAGATVLIRILTTDRQQFRKLATIIVTSAAAIAIVDLGIANLFVAQQVIHVVWVDFLILALCISYVLFHKNKNKNT